MPLATASASWAHLGHAPAATGGQPVHMEDAALRLNDVLLFEIPSYADVDQLHARIRPRWRGWTTCEDEVWLVAAEVKADARDLAALLREVEAYVAATELLAIRYWVDGRFHIMEARALERVA